MTPAFGLAKEQSPARTIMTPNVPDRVNDLGKIDNRIRNSQFAGANSNLSK